MDLLDESVTRMEKSLKDRVAEGKCALSESEVKSAAEKIGYGAVKYADLHQHPATNYKFSYDKMLSTSGNTAVYLLFAHARLASIVRKASAKGVDAKKAASNKMDLCAHPKERALAFELTQFSGVVASVAEEFLPVRVCDYLYKVSCKFTEFVTECKVLDDARMAERVVLCEATGEQAIGGEGSRCPGVLAILLEDVIGLMGEIRHLRDAGLHSKGHLMLRDAGEDFGVFGLVKLDPLEPFEVIELTASVGLSDALGIVEVEDGAGSGTKLHALVF